MKLGSPLKPLGSNDPSAVASYRLIGVLGGGGMGRVYLGESRTGRRVAIKVVRDELAEDPVFRRRFAREVAAAKVVSPLYTAAVVDADPDAEAPWLATTFIDGPTLTELVLAGGPLSAHAVLTLAAGLSEALASIHRVGLVHRDLKPSNVIINDTGPHIIDFGIALTVESTGRLTTSRVVGTPSYIAPEIILGGEPTTAGDVFSLGATLVFAATGKHLVADGTVYAQILQITTGRFDLETVPRQLRPVIVRCISPEPKDRPTADELAHILVAAGVTPPTPDWYRSQGTAPVVVMAPPRVATTLVPLSRRRLLAAGGLLGAAALGSAVGLAAGWLGRPDAWGDAAWRAGQPPAPPPPTATPPPASGRGSVLWDGSSGARSTTVSGAQQPGVRVIADHRKQIIAADGSDVIAVSPEGRQLWKRTLPTPGVNLRPWGDDLLATDARTIWLLDATSGIPTFTYKAADQEESDARYENPDNLAMEIGAIALSGDRAFIGLGTAVIALNRRLERIWRQPRPYGRRGSSMPRGANDFYVVVHTVDNQLVEITLRRAADGARMWFRSYNPGPSSNVQGPPPGPGGDRPGGPPDGGPPPQQGSWSAAEGRFGGAFLALRDSQAYRVLDLGDGRTVWQGLAEKPVASFEVIGDLLLVGSDRVNAYALDSGAFRWRHDLRGAVIAAVPDGRLIVLANDERMMALAPNGTVLWQTPLPPAMAGSVPERLTIDSHTAYLTFLPPESSQSGRPGSRVVDTLALSID